MVTDAKVTGVTVGCGNGIARKQRCRVGRSLAGEVIHGDWIFEQGIVACNHADSALSYEITLPVGFGVVADGGALGNVYVAIDDGLADAAMPAHIYMGKQDAC